MQTSLTPSQLVWGKFYATLHEEILKLEVLAQKKTAESDSTYQAGKDSTVDQRQPLKASKDDFSQYVQK